MSSFQAVEEKTRLAVDVDDYTIRSRIMPKIAKKLNFLMRRTVEVHQRNNNQPPNSFFCGHCD